MCLSCKASKRVDQLNGSIAYHLLDVQSMMLTCQVVLDGNRVMLEAILWCNV